MAGRPFAFSGSRREDLGLQPDKIGICGFSAGGHLAISCALYAEPKSPEGEVSGMPDFAGLFYPGIPDDARPDHRKPHGARVGHAVASARCSS